MKTIFSAIQWMAFMIASSIVAPIAIASIYHLSPAETAGLVQRTMFVLGIAGLLQGFFGHRLPINEGPAGLWWGVFTIYAGLSATLFSSKIETLQALQFALITSGIIFMLLSAAKLIDKIASLFTPVVTAIYLLLLVIQLSGSFINGMFGIGYRKSVVDWPIACFSFVLVLLTFYLTKHRSRLISQYSVLIAIVAGWGLFALFDLAKPIVVSQKSWIELPKIFTFGLPKFDGGMVVTAIFVSLLLLTNMIASIRVVKEVLLKEGEHVKDKGNFKCAGYISGINQMLGGLFSAIGPVPISGSAGFISTTRIHKLAPFLIGCCFIVITSLFPALMAVLASLPAPVGYSVTFVVFANMIGIAFSELEKETDMKRIRIVIGISLMAGVGAMFVPAAAFKGSSPLLTSFFNNGLIFGSVIAIVVDQWTKKYATIAKRG